MALLGSSDLKRVAQLVSETTGNRVQEKNYSMLESRMSTRLLRLGLSTMSEYWEYFAANEIVEREAIQSLMTTHHTFFFREYAHFEVLEDWIAAELPRLKARFAQTKEPVRVWSAACSRGQEVYSLAMFLDKTLKNKHGIDFQIVGTDIDKESVAFAQNGVYPIKEVNTIPHEYLNGYWKKGTGPVREFAAVHPSLKKAVRFEVLNLLEVDSWQQAALFDVVFCRNVFIYFSEADVEKIAHSLARRLHPDALFVSGISEPLRFASWKFESAGPSSYRQTARKTREAPVASAESVIPVRSVPIVPARSAEARSPKYKVLCVDDSTTIQALMRRIFATDPLCERVEVAGNGREAREMLNAGKFDLITLDIHMPEVGGIEFLERLYRKNIDPPVLMVSSVNRTDVDLATRSLSLGAFDYVEKPAMNNLQKSRDELLMKAKMALRSTAQGSGSNAGEFDVSISQQIVVPDASQCLRVVIAGASSRLQLEQVLRAQSKESRSPALLVLLPPGDQDPIEATALTWTQRSIVSLKDPSQTLKPNHVYFLREDSFEAYLPRHRLKSLSLQVLENRSWDGKNLHQIPEIQILIDERIEKEVDVFRNRYHLRVSDVAPATSFASLSLEFFAKVRKAA